MVVDGGASALLLLILSALYLTSICAQPSATCEPFAGSPTYCSDSVTYQIYLPQGVSQLNLSSTLLKELPEGILGLIPVACRPYTLLMSCGRAFRSCNGSDPEEPPLPMCNSTCTTFNELGGKNLTDCGNERDVFNPSSRLFDDIPSCSNHYVPSPPSSSNISCPTYFYALNGECAPGCPFPPFHDVKRNAISQVRYRSSIRLTPQKIFRYILPFSILMEVLMVGTWLVIWDSNRPLYVAFFLLGLFFQHFGIFIGKWLSFEEWQCVDNKLRDQSNTGCAIQGLLGLMGTYTPVAWVGVILYHLFNSVTAQKYQIFGEGKLIPINSKYIYHIIVWGLFGGVLTLTSFGLDRINAQAGYLCYPDGRVDDLKYLYGILFTPVTILICVEVILTGVLFYTIVRLAGLSGLRTQGRLTALCAYYLITSCYLVFNAWDVFRKRHQTTRDVTAFVECIVNNFQTNVVPDTTGCGRGPHWNDDKELLGDVLVAIDGLVIGLILLDPRFFKIWKQMLQGRFSRAEWSSAGLTSGSRHTNTGLSSRNSGSVSNSRL